MQHPSHEELLLHLEGASTPATAKRLEGHLESCPQCAAEAAGWQRTMQKLQNLDWPKQPNMIHRRWSSVGFKWAAAAVFVLAMGFGLGRLSARSTIALKESITADVLQAVQKTQEEDQRRLTALLEEVQQQHNADFLAIRHDLETAVTEADNDLKQNRRHLTELAKVVFSKDPQN